MRTISEFLNKDSSNRVKIGVVGDVMVDEFFSVRVTRISPEFPTQIMLSKTTEPDATVPGGAANVCLQMSKWNVDCNLICFRDHNANKAFGAHSFSTEFSCSIADGSIPLKRRFYDRDYPLPRWDVEQENYGCSTIELGMYQNNLLDNFNDYIKTCQPNIVILSDYGKGLFTNGVAEKIIKICNDAKVPTIVDPKDPPVDRWRGCTYFKPNAFETVKITEIPHPSQPGNWWEHYNKLAAQGFTNVIITDGPYPPFIPYLDPKIELVREPNKQSVIGAGDCFCAFLAMALSHKMKLNDAVEVAWNASSLYIEAKHNKPLMPHEFAKWNDPVGSKLVSVDQLKRIMNYDKCVWAFTNGCFDIIHLGHLKSLKFAQRHGDKVIVGLNTDDSVRKLKGPTRPVLPFAQRVEHLSHLQYIDFIVPIEDETPLSVIEQLKPQKIIKGASYQKKDIAGWEVVGEENVILVPLIEGLSTTKIIEKLKT